MPVVKVTDTAYGRLPPPHLDRLGAFPAIPVHRQALNDGAERLKRKGELLRLKPGPSQVKRIGHGVMGTPRVRETVQWFRETLGLVPSDDLYAGSPDNLIGSFNRCD